MKTLITIFTVVILLNSQKSFADDSNANCDNIINANVNGLVCDFCAKALEKVFGKHEEFESLKIDLDKGLVKIFTKPEKTFDDETVEKLVLDAGYNLVSIERGCLDG